MRTREHSAATHSAIAPLVRSPAIAVIALGLGLVARVQGMASSLWVDEFGTLWVAEASLSQTVQRAIHVQGQTPLYYVLVWGALRTIGESELSLRILSLAAILAATVAIWRAGRAVAGEDAGAMAALLFWFSPPLIAYSASARPYALGVFFATLAVLGFLGACTSGAGRSRIVFVLGSAGLVWTHYLMAPMLAGLVAPYFFIGQLRQRYGWRRFATDMLAIALLLAPTIPQLLAIVNRRDALSWAPARADLSAFTPFLPVVAIAVLALVAARRPHGTLTRHLMLSLWLAGAAQVGVLSLAGLAGTNLLALRFLIVALVPLTVLAGANLSRTHPGVRIAMLLAFLLLSARELRSSHQVFGSFSGAGFQPWREMVAALSEQLTVDPDAPVLFRSGFVEDDLPPLSEPAPMSLAPLRSPGHPSVHMNIVPLPFRWSNPHLDEYLDGYVRPRLTGRREFFFLGPPTREPTIGTFAENLQRWVASRWPGQFAVSKIGTTESILLLRFQRSSTPVGPWPNGRD